MKNLLVLKVLAGTVLAMLAIFLVAKTRTEWAQRDYVGKAVRDRDVILVGGTGKVTSKPDLALVQIGIYSEGPTVNGVQADNTAKMNRIIESLKSLGIDKADIQTSNYNLQPAIDWSNGRQNIRGYTLSQNISVKVRDLPKIGEALEQSISAGANQINGVTFTIDEPSSLQDQARLKAIEDAKRKAEALASATGLKIIKVVSFSESGGTPPMMPYAGDAMYNQRKEVPQIESGSLDVEMNVSVTFEVR